MFPAPTVEDSHDGFIQIWHADAHTIRREIVGGLNAPAATISPKFLYDALGSKLFEAICELPEYYPTRTESSILNKHIVQIAHSIGRGSTIIDLGAGNCAKASNLFVALQPEQYVPVDISVEFLRDAVQQLRQRFPHIEMIGIGMDFSSSLMLPPAVNADKRLFFYPGSSIGNFMPDQAAKLLARMHEECGREGGLLIGVDLVKDKDVLEAAYDDALGVTAAFNLNLLNHLNAIVGANFRLSDWKHRAFFNEQLSRIEMHLVARRRTEVEWDGGGRIFEEGESIHTECSHKYSRANFVQMLERAGFSSVRTWSDEHDWFMVCHARANQGS